MHCVAKRGEIELQIINSKATPINVVLGEAKPSYKHTMPQLGLTCKAGNSYLKYKTIFHIISSPPQNRSSALVPVTTPRMCPPSRYILPSVFIIRYQLDCGFERSNFYVSYETRSKTLSGAFLQQLFSCAALKGKFALNHLLNKYCASSNKVALECVCLIID